MDGYSQALWRKHCRKLGEYPEDFGNQEAREEAALDYTLESAYFKRVDGTRYGVLVVELKNEYVKGQDDYPIDLATSFALVNLYETP